MVPQKNQPLRVESRLWPWLNQFFCRIEHFSKKHFLPLFKNGILSGTLICYLILWISTSIQAQAFLEWAQRAGGTGDEGGLAIAADPSGNSYATGNFRSMANFGGTVLTIAGADDVYVAKYNNNGSLSWIKQAGGTDGDAGRGITVDGSGNIYVSGGFRGTASFEATNLVSAGSHDIFLAKYNNNGNFQWANRYCFPRR